MRKARRFPPAPAHLPLLKGSGAAPDIDRGEQEQPDHIDEVPVPGGGLETDVLLGGELTLVQPDQAGAALKHVIEKEGFRFDLGPTIVMMPELYREIFEYAGKDPGI